MSAAKVQKLFYHESGLKGLSGIGNDMCELEASSDPAAGFALDYFCYRVGLYTGMLAAIDVRAGLLSPTLQALRNIGFIEAAKKGHLPSSFSTSVGPPLPRLMRSWIRQPTSVMRNILWSRTSLTTRISSSGTRRPTRLTSRGYLTQSK